VLKPFDLLENILIDIEHDIKNAVTIGALAEKYSLSERHLHRLFKFAFKQTIAGYIRSRKLAASIDDLLNTDLNVLDIALDYDFEYEQSYIRSFLREYGITPGGLRKTGKILKITPPLQLFNAQQYPDGIVFGPEIVVIPQFHVIGKRYKIPFRDSMLMPISVTKQCLSELPADIPNVVNPYEQIVISSEAAEDADYWYFMPAIRVKSLDIVPEGFDSYTFPTSLCAKFRFINNNADPSGTPEFNLYNANGMFKAINDFMDSEDQQYFLERKRVDIGISVRDECYPAEQPGSYSHHGWFAPVIKKTSLKIPSLSPSGIKKAYKQELPALRFIGKKCVETAEPVKVLNLLDNWQLNRWFDAIEKQSGIDYKTFCEGGDAYINLVRKKGALYEHWMGMFTPGETGVPDGYEAIDFPPMAISVCRVYGKRDEIVDYETECRDKLTAEGFAPENAPWYLRRFNWHCFFKEDVYGKRLLDYCYPA
jgi:AraC family transcriptional regulator